MVETKYAKSGNINIAYQVVGKVLISCYCNGLSV